MRSITSWLFEKCTILFLINSIMCLFFMGPQQEKKTPLTCFFIISYLTYHLETTSSSTTICSDRLQSDFTVSWSISVCTPSLVSFCLFWRFPRLNKTVYNIERQLTELFSFVSSFQNPPMPRNLKTIFFLSYEKDSIQTRLRYLCIQHICMQCHVFICVCCW